MADFKYDDYGIGESYLPKVYFNKITVDVANKNHQLNDDILPYIDEDTVYREPQYNKRGDYIGDIETTALKGKYASYNKKSNTKEETKLTIDTKILFNVSDIATFQSIVEDDEFDKSFKINYYVFYEKDFVPKYNDDVLSQYFPVLHKALEEDKETKDLIEMNANFGERISVTLGEIKKQIINDVHPLSTATKRQSVKPFDVFKRYQKEFPDGTIYFEIPYEIEYTIQGEEPRDVFLIAVPYAKPMNLDITLNFGQFFIEDTTSLQDLTGIDFENLEISGKGATSAKLSFAPVTFETVIKNYKAIDYGAVFKISDEQSSDTFDDIKGLPWFGGVHKHAGKYMAGAEHTDDPHPLLDILYVQNRKVVDLRVIKRVKDAQINFSTLNEDLDLNKVRYGGSFDTKYSLDGLPIFSECWLSNHVDGAINGIFGIDYIKFFRVHGLIPTLLDQLTDVDGDSVVAFKGMFFGIVQKMIKSDLTIKIFRHGPAEKKLVYDSNRVNESGIYPQNVAQNLVKGGTKTAKPDPLGHLNPIALSDVAIDLPDVSMFEFYTFSDLDKNKNFDTEYSYEIEITMEDPLFLFLKTALQLLDWSIDGMSPMMGLNQLISLVSAQPKNTNILNESGSPYIEGTFADLSTPEDDIWFSKGQPYVPQMPILQLIKEYDQRNAVSSFNVVFNSVVSKTGILRSVDTVLSANILPILLNSQKDGTNINNKELASTVTAAISLTDNESISLSNIVYIRDMFQSLRSDLANVIDGLSNVNHSKGGDSESAALNSSVSPGNTNSSLRRITAKKHFDYTIKRTNYGLDYTKFLPEESTLADGSIKSISSIEFLNTMTEMLTNYFNPKMADVIGTSFEGTVQPSGYSYLPLFPKGIELPDRLRSESIDSDNWNDLFQSMVLFKEEKLSPMSENNIFAYHQETKTASNYFKRSISGLSKKDSTSVFKQQKGKVKQLIKAERNQTLASEFGLSIQDKIDVGQGVEIVNDKATGRKIKVQTTRQSSNTNTKTNYFLSYVNNFTEGDLDVDDIYPVSFDPSNQPDQTPVPVLALMFASNPSNQEWVVQAAPSYYNSLFDAESGQLYASRFAEYFFTFLNYVQVDYLATFKKFQNTSATSEGPKAKTIIDIDNMALNSAIWEKLTYQTILQMPAGKSLVCRITDYKLPFYMSNGIRKELSFYPNFNKYFLITGDDLVSSTLNEFGSQIIRSGVGE